MDIRLISLILLIHISGCLSLDLLYVTCEDVCALRENTVHWDYSGRVKKEAVNKHSTLTISDLRERDSGEYQLMFIMKDGVKRLGSVAVNLTVTDLQVRMNPATTDPRDETVKLTCGSSCDLTSRPQNYFWKKNGQYLKLGDNIYKGISFLANGSDGSYSCSLTADYKISSSPVCISKDHCWDVTYTSRRVCALTGSTVDISCTYSPPSGYTVNKTFWHYDLPGDFKDLREKHQFAGRVEYVGNTLRIKELKMNDSGEYRFRIISDTTGGTYSGSPGVILTVTDTMVTSSPDIISERQEVILSCSTKCTLSDKHTYIWYKNGRQVTDGFTKDNKLYLDSVSNEELQEYSCAVRENQEESTALQNTVIILSVFLVLALIGVLWYRRRRSNSSQQHEERKDDVQSGSATLYDNAEALSTVCTQDVKDQDVHYSAINFKQSHIKDTSLAPTAVHSTSDDVHYASVKFSLPSV
ncbi:carcinoembryonic antigen-related cell adhesion molecule 1-like isoform X8 [Ctenopharyngodon idella]|uniref:carcinoembryonic antigen-related cell adhesion molecule 1-like isoform X8 n=1 Tax=Ctenopharyngodon idella TaxID=7959 RepID=UPI00222E6582|nr:carcinoembryonic antigen-related cell adhesion molecule 1-like isoform X8 [Ctenopharyngodon idella]